MLKVLPGQLEVLRSSMRDVQSRARAAIDLPDDGLTERVLHRFALIALAGEVATKAGITGWKPGEALQAAIEVLRLWIEGRDLPTRDEITASIRRLSDFVAAYPTRFIPLTTPVAQVTRRHIGWVDNAVYYFTDEVWAEIHRGFDPMDVARQMQSRQLLLSNEQGLKYRMGRQVVNRPRCYAVRRAGIDPIPTASAAA